MTYWTPELTGVVVGGLVGAFGKGIDYQLRVRGDRRSVEREAVDEVMPLLEQLRAPTRTRLVQGSIVASTIRAGESGFKQADDEGFREIAIQQSNAFDAFEIAAENVHADDARAHCAEYAALARETAKAAAWVPNLDSDEALEYIKASKGCRDALEDARRATRAALGAARRA